MMTTLRRRRLTVVLSVFLSAGGMLSADLGSQRASFAGDETIEKSALEYVWTYRRIDGIDPPEAGTVFCVVTDPDQPGARRLIIGTESILQPAKIGTLLRGRASNADGVVLHQASAPAREISFNRFDLDGDGVDEVLLTGRGGAGGTSLLSAYRIGDKGVTRIFADASRFGFYLIDADGRGKYEIANPGFESIAGTNSELREKEFVVYHLREGVFCESRRLTADAFARVIESLAETRGIPIPAPSQVGILQVYKGKRQKTQRSQ